MNKSLRARILSGSSWTLIGYGLSQLVRFTSNIILARILFPEAFGLMVLVSVFLQGISMFSDIGINTSIVQSKYGHERNFLDTAWTIQIIRGFALWVITCVFAYPYSIIYSETQLAGLLPVAGLTALIAGFNSTSLALADRYIRLAKVTILDVISQVLGIVLMITLAILFRSVWALVAGGILSALVKMTLSHLWLSDTKNKLHWDPQAISRIIGFGKWILASTALTFFARQIDRLMIGYFAGIAMLGVYSIALMMVQSAQEAIQKLSARVLFAGYAELYRAGDQVKFYNALRKTRVILIILTWLVSILLMSFGGSFINFLYDDRYSDAAWMIEIMALAPLIGVLSFTYQSAYLAMGQSSHITFILIFQLILQVVAITLGYSVAGLEGVVIGLVAMAWLLYPANAVFSKVNRIWQPEIDFIVIGAAVVYLVFYIT